MNKRSKYLSLTILFFFILVGQASSEICYDVDGDGYDGFDNFSGFGAYSSAGCNINDCNDWDPNVNPGAIEVCGDGIDNDCAGGDELCPPIDGDNDGYASDVDCNDADPEINPGATEICSNGIDDNCDSLTDYQDPTCNTPECLDADNDGFGSFENFSTFSNLTGLGCTWDDCNDNDQFINPVATEVCNDLADNDCNGLIDCQDTTACGTDPACITCTDGDGDGYAIEGGDCGPVDCNDNNPAVSPGGVEACNDGVDNDCDDQVDCADGDCTGDTACQVCVPEICDDGIDNDCDNKIDCSDKSDCAKNPVCKN